MPKQLSHSSSLFSFFEVITESPAAMPPLLSRACAQLASNPASMHQAASPPVQHMRFDVIAAVLAGGCSSCVDSVVDASDVGGSPDVNELRAEARPLQPVIGRVGETDPLFTGNASLPFSRPASRRREREGRRPAATALCPLPAARCNLPPGLGGAARSSFLDHSKLLHFIHLHAHSCIFSFLDGAHNAPVIALVHFLPTRPPDHPSSRCPDPRRSPNPAQRRASSAARTRR